MDPRYQKSRETARPGAAVHPAAAAAGSASHAQPTHHVPVTKSNGFSKKWVIGLLLLTLLVVGGLFAWNYFDTKGVAKNKYQAVFLVNDQVYFGKISKIDRDVLVINDIYYLQQTSQEGADQNQNAAASSQPNTSLAKLGSEVHGPEDEMRINMEQVLFWENLKDDGQVVKAIKADKDKK